jgi:hypothetical protein
MAGKRSKADPTDDQFDELFEGIGDEASVKKSAKSKAPASAAKSKPDTAEQDILAELENQLVDEKPSRPHTPRIRETAPKGSPAKRTSTNTPPPPSSAAEEKHSNVARKSAESTRSYHASFTPSATSSELQEPDKKLPTEQGATATATGGGWWGGILSTATAAMKQAEAAVKEIQQNEEAKKWAEQVRGNVGALKGLGRNSLT